MAAKKSEIMSGYEARKIDTEFYVDYDEDNEYWGVFGDNSGFCYFLGEKDIAEERAKQMNSEKSSKRESKISNQFRRLVEQHLFEGERVWTDLTPDLIKNAVSVGWRSFADGKPPIEKELSNYFTIGVNVKKDTDHFVLQLVNLGVLFVLYGNGIEVELVPSSFGRSLGLDSILFSKQFPKDKTIEKAKDEMYRLEYSISELTDDPKLSIDIIELKLKGLGFVKQ